MRDIGSPHPVGFSDLERAVQALGRYQRWVSIRKIKIQLEGFQGRSRNMPAEKVLRKLVADHLRRKAFIQRLVKAGIREEK